MSAATDVHAATTARVADAARYRRPLLESLTRATTARGSLLVATLGAVGQHAATIAAAGAGGWLVGAAAGGKPTSGLVTGVIVLAAAVAVAMAGTWVNMLFGHAFAFRYQAALRLAIFDGLERSAPRVLQGRRSGELAAVTMGDVDALEGFYAHLGITTVAAGLVGAAAVAVLGVFDPLFALIAAVGAVILAALPAVAARRTARTGQELRAELGSLNADVVDGVQGLRELIVFRQSRAWAERIRSHTRAYKDLQVTHGRAAGLQQAVTDLVMSVTILAILITAVARAADHTISLATATTAVTLVIAALATVAEATGMAGQLAPLRAAARRVLDVIDQPAQIIDPADGSAPAPAATGVGVRFDDVTFGYEPGHPVLRHTTFDVAPGETVAIAGSTGAGKTTCANLLLRFWDPDEGSVSLGGTDLRDIPLTELRRLVTVVPQDVYLFAGSIADNLRLGAPDATGRQVAAAAAAANAHEFVTALPGGYATPITERGARLSGGQRQRLAIARALLVDSPVLVMDEAASNLDTENERDIQAAIRRARQGRTTVIIAHRLSTIRSADRVVFIDQGRVAATGTHDELLAADAAYARLIDSQISHDAAV